MSAATACHNRYDSKGLSGLRALACLGVLVGHAVYWLASAFNSAEFYGAMAAAPLLIFSVNIIEPAMEIFLFFTGYFAALALIPKLETTAKTGSSQWAIVKQYWGKRAWRIIPHYYCVLAATQFGIIPVLRENLLGEEMTQTFTIFSPWPSEVCEKLIWMNYLFINNFLDLSGCGNYTWSLCVQVQFYFTFPLLLLFLQPGAAHFRKRLALVCGVVMVASNVAKFYMFSRPWVPVPVPMLGPYTPEILESLKVMGHGHYHGSLPRLMHIFPGVLTSLLLLDEPTRVWLQRHSKGLALGVIGLFTYVVLFCAFQRVGMDDPTHFLQPHWRFAAAFFVFEGLLCPAMVMATVLTVTTGESTLAAMISRVLSNPLLLCVADISYDVYLLNPIALLLVYWIAPPSVWFLLAAPSTIQWLAVTIFYIAMALCLSTFMGRALKQFGL